MQSDRELVAESLRGKQESFGVLVERYERAVLAVTVRVLHDREAARDVAQDSFVAAYRKLRSLRDPGEFASWLLRIAHNRAVSVLRSRSRTPALSPLPDTLASRPPHRLGERSERVLEALMRLPENERLVISLRYFDGRSVQEVATATGRPVGTVTKQLSRAYERLRGLLSAKETRPSEPAIPTSPCQEKQR